MMFGRQIMWVYLKDAEEAITYGLLRIKYVISLYFFCGLMDGSAGLSRGLGYSIVPTVITLTGACLMRIVWVYTVFRVYRTYISLVISMPISWIISSIAGIAAFIIIKRHVERKTLSGGAEIC